MKQSVFGWMVIVLLLVSAPTWGAAVYDAVNGQLTLTSANGPNTSTTIVADLNDATLASTDGMWTTINIPTITLAGDAEWVIGQSETVLVRDPQYPRTVKPQIIINGTFTIIGATLDGFIELDIQDGASINWLSANLMADQAGHGGIRATNGVICINGVPASFVWDGGVCDFTGPGAPADLAYEGIRYRPSLVGANAVTLTCTGVTFNSRFYLIRSLNLGLNEGDNDVWNFVGCTFAADTANGLAAYSDNGSPSCIYNFINCIYVAPVYQLVRFGADANSKINLINLVVVSTGQPGIEITAESNPADGTTVGLPATTLPDGTAQIGLTYQAFIGPDNANDIPSYTYTINSPVGSATGVDPAVTSFVDLTGASLVPFFEEY